MANLGTRGAIRRNRFGDIALLLFLLAQASDGVLTYVGVSTYGVGIEGNPVIAWLIGALGEGLALTTAKLAAGVFGIALHFFAVHKVVAILAVFYFAVAVLPWMAVLFAY
jgi:uncharacterized membrane protein